MVTTEANLRSDSKPQEEIEVDWSDLPADLLQSISKKLPDIADFIYFRTVCKRWRTATPISDLTFQIPWLLEEGDINREYLRFYCLLSGKVRTVQCPQSHGKWLRGLSHGYLYADSGSSCNDMKHSLINPLTKDEVTIPFLKYSNGHLSCMGPHPFGNDHMAFLLAKNGDGSTIIGFYQPRSGEWKYPEGFRYNLAMDQACLKGMYYRNELETGIIVVVDIPSGSSFLIPPPEIYNQHCFVHFVESAGKILRIDRKSDPSLDNYFFDIYELDVEGQNDKFRWVKTSSIGDQMLFLGWDSGISVTASQSTGLMGNCIYFLTHEEDSGEWNCEVYRYNLEDGKTERIPCPFRKAITWLVPSVVDFLPDDPY